MTIACCYVSPEGVVLGADSTTTSFLAGGPHYFNHAQKLFELGNGATLGVVIWGMAALGPASYRTLFADLAEALGANPPATVEAAIGVWTDQFWAVYEAAYLAEPDFARFVDEVRQLDKKPPFDPAQAPPNPAARTSDEESRYQQLKRALAAGFCIGGRVEAERKPAAWVVQFEFVNQAKPVPKAIPVNTYSWFGVPNMFQRLIMGLDEDTKQAIEKSPHWKGTLADLEAVIKPFNLEHGMIPLRDVVDFVHSCIFSTIKALKFSPLSQVCGGPIELAVISTDRPFRWIRHKAWDAAVVDGAPI